MWAKGKESKNRKKRSIKKGNIFAKMQQKKKLKRIIYPRIRSRSVGLPRVNNTTEPVLQHVPSARFNRYRNVLRGLNTSGHRWICKIPRSNFLKIMFLCENLSISFIPWRATSSLSACLVASAAIVLSNCMPNTILCSVRWLVHLCVHPRQSATLFQSKSWKRRVYVYSFHFFWVPIGYY